MNQKVYTVERNGIIKTVKSASGAGGAAVLMFPDLRPISWVVTKRHSITNGDKQIVVNGCVTVTEVDTPLSSV